MDIRSLTSGLSYRGEVEAKRQTYYVFEGKKSFFVLSFSRSKHNAGNFNIVDVEAVRYAAKLFGDKKGITSKQVVKSSRKPQYIATTFDALNVLYVLVATRRAVIDKRHKAKELYFNCR